MCLGKPAMGGGEMEWERMDCLREDKVGRGLKMVLHRGGRVATSAGKVPPDKIFGCSSLERTLFETVFQVNFEWLLASIGYENFTSQPAGPQMFPVQVELKLHPSPPDFKLRNVCLLHGLSYH